MHGTVDTVVRSDIPSGGESRAGQSFRGCPRRRTGGESATNVKCAILYVLRGHPVGRDAQTPEGQRMSSGGDAEGRGGEGDEEAKGWDAADAAGRERAYGTCGGAGVGEDAQRRERGRLAPGEESHREEGRVGQGLRVGKPATAASRTSGNRGRRAMAIGGEPCGARRRCIGYGV